MALPTQLLFLSTVLFLLPSPSSSTATNLLFTGDILPANTQLSTCNAIFTIHDDCNLALYKPTLCFQFNTRILHTSNCTLALSDRGQLLIRSPNGSAIWSSSPSTKTGRYAALLRPDGHVAIYHPLIWSTSTPRLRSDGGAEVAKHSPNARNHMFSSQVLYDNSKLASGVHALVMNCFARLDHRGQLAVVDGRFKVVWASKAADADGFYVLVVQNDGRAAVYGPAIWSTDT